VAAPGDFLLRWRCRLRVLANWIPCEQQATLLLRGVSDARLRWVVAEVEPPDGPPAPCGGTSAAIHGTNRTTRGVVAWTKLHDTSGACGSTLTIVGVPPLLHSAGRRGPGRATPSRPASAALSPMFWGENVRALVDVAQRRIAPLPAAGVPIASR
jgi:hypothetical protein